MKTVDIERSWSEETIITKKEIDLMMEFDWEKKEESFKNMAMYKNDQVSR